MSQQSNIQVSLVSQPNLVPARCAFAWDCQHDAVNIECGKPVCNIHLPAAIAACTCYDDDIRDIELAEMLLWD